MGEWRGHDQGKEAGSEMKETGTDRRPIVAVTMGDPAGAGPEVIIKVLAEPRVYEWSRPLVIGDSRPWSGRES
jgi:hypothetical protein